MSRRRPESRSAILPASKPATGNIFPAPTYTIGFAKSYAAAVGLDRTEIGNQLREEMGGQRFATQFDRRVRGCRSARGRCPSGWCSAPIAAVIVLIAADELAQQSLARAARQKRQQCGSSRAPLAQLPRQSAHARCRAVAQGPVVLTATAPVWLQVSEKGSSASFRGVLQPGQTITVPANRGCPSSRPASPKRSRSPSEVRSRRPVGPAATTVSNVSLRPPTL